MCFVVGEGLSALGWERACLTRFNLHNLSLSV